MTSAIESLSTRLLPWLEPAFRQFETALGRSQLGHAWLISGPAGMGKINLALVLANLLLGARTTPAKLDADTALAALAARHSPMDRHPDLHWLYPEEDKETISVEQVRDLIDSFALTSHRGRGKVVIVEPAEALTPAAANALLKTLEEPSRDSYLLLLSHQPGRLVATIRSRCQHLKLAAPPTDVVAAWLEAPTIAVAEAAGAVGSAPLKIAAAVRGNDSRIFNVLHDDLTRLCEDRADPVAVAHAWAKDHAELALSWLKRRLHEELRARSGAGPTEVTVPAVATLHNAWRNVPTRTLFDQYQRAEQLHNLLGSGLNVELAFQALLSGFVANRGRT
jgi:DNA polymerase-3 subunit delta'